MKDVSDVNTSNTSSNTSDVLKNGKMYSSVLKDVSDVLFSWQDVLNDVLLSCQDVSSDVLKNCKIMMYCLLYCRSSKGCIGCIEIKQDVLSNACGMY